MNEICFGCGKEFFILETPMRCHECVKNKIPVRTSPVIGAYWVLEESSEVDKKTNSEIKEL